MLKEFKKFALRGNMLDMAVGIIVGGAFGTIAKSFVNDIIMPPIGLLLGGVDFQNLFILLRAGDPGRPYATLADAQAASAVTINYGVFINSLISLLIVALVMFLLVKGMNQLEEQAKAKKPTAPPAAPTTKECPYCYSTIPLKATRCPECTSELS